jgi:4-hydroxy-tetrahydrodipicolinate synthase
MATPFTADGDLDLDGAQVLADHLIRHGNDGVVVAGTTGESPTLTHDETVALFRAVVEAVGERADVVANCGKNDTAASVAMVRDAAAVGVDAIMLVTPYYNKPSQRGLVHHFTTCAAATELPVLLYDVPSRTITTIEAETVLRLAELVPNLVGLKDAAVNPSKTLEISRRAPEGFAIWSGDDATILPTMAAGGIGVISVAAHLVGDDIAAMIDVFATDPHKAREIAGRIHPVCTTLFAEPSPAPLKAGLALLGLPGGPVRGPLVDASDDVRARLRDALVAAGVEVPSA